MLRSWPHAEDPKATAGGDRTDLQRGRGKPTPFGPAPQLGNSPASPPGENKDFLKAGVRRGSFGRSTDSLPSRGTQSEMDRAGHTVEGVVNDAADDEIENQATEAGLPADDEPDEPEHDFLDLVREAEAQSSRYLSQMNLNNWGQAYRAFHQQHFAGSKYTTVDWRNRSRFFRPKTRSAVRKDMAAVAASLFNNIDAINCLAGNESDPQQRGAAAVMQELVNYRTDRTSGRHAIPWLMVAMGARQDSLLTGVCISKQSWKMELRKDKAASAEVEQRADGRQVRRDTWVPDVDRPDIQLIPPENIIIDPAADWTNPIQTGQYTIIKWPMTLDEVRQKMQSPVNPWNEVDDSVLRASTDVGTFNTAAVRRAREMDLDRLNEAQTGNNFQIVWVYECFIRIAGEDWTFLSCTDRAYLTDPKPVREVYPEQGGERPLVMGFSALEAHRIYPMAPVTSWQQMQGELNDIVNLTLDAIKQNVMPVSKVVRGRNIDLDQVKRRASGSSIIVQNKDDVTWEHLPDVPQSVPVMTRELELEMDDLAGQFNGQTAENSNALSRTLGGLKLVAGSANAVQEFDIRVWIETWTEPVLAQLVKLEQYYESDAIVLGLCGERAQLLQKHGINEITDKLLEAQVSIRCNVGLGAGDPQQRLQKFAMATQIALPILQQSKKFQSGEWTMNEEAIMQEVYGGAGYRDGGMRFITKGQPQPNPMQDLQVEELKSKIEKNKQTGKSSMLTGLAAVAKVALGNRELEAQTADAQLDFRLRAHDLGHQHAAKLNEQHLAAIDHGNRHGLAIAGHRQGVDTANREHGFKQAESDRAQHNTDRQFDMDKAMAADAAGDAGAGGGGGGASAAPAAASPAPQGPGPMPAFEHPEPAAPQPGAMPHPPHPQAAPMPLAGPPPSPHELPGPPPMPAPAPRRIIRFEFIRDPHTGKIVGAVPVYEGESPQEVAAAHQMPASPATPPPFANRQPSPAHGSAAGVPLPPFAGG